MRASTVRGFKQVMNRFDVLNCFLKALCPVVQRLELAGEAPRLTRQTTF
jgi:hypothetical protein